MKATVFLLFVLINTSVLSRFYKPEQLELVQALFRHGERIPDKRELYKTDPYNPEYYVPIGYGQLTKVGMQREYQIGQLLRKLYRNFLGEYQSDKVYAYSTDVDRTKVSLQLVLAGLFPPTIKSAWNEQLMWTPIPYHYEPLNADFLQSPLTGSCGDLEMLQRTIENIPEVYERMVKHKNFFNYVQNVTEIRDTHLITITLLASNLVAVKSMNLPLPSWCSERDFEKLIDIMKIFFKSLSMTPELRKLIAGPMVKQFLDNMKNHKKDDERKLYLYSGHDLNIAPFMGAHNFTWIPSIVEFGSTVIIEKLRGIDNQSYVRMFLWTGVSKRLISLKLKNCDYKCPLSIYEKIVTPILPNPDLIECLSRNSHSNGASPGRSNSLRLESYMTLTIMLILILNVACI